MYETSEEILKVTKKLTNDYYIFNGLNCKSKSKGSVTFRNHIEIPRYRMMYDDSFSFLGNYLNQIEKKLSNLINDDETNNIMPLKIKTTFLKI